MNETLKQMQEDIEDLKTWLSCLETTVWPYEHWEVVRIWVDQCFDMIERLQSRLDELEWRVEAIEISI